MPKESTPVLHENIDNWTPNWSHRWLKKPQSQPMPMTLTRQIRDTCLPAWPSSQSNMAGSQTPKEGAEEEMKMCPCPPLHILRSELEKEREGGGNFKQDGMDFALPNVIELGPRCRWRMGKEDSRWSIQAQTEVKLKCCMPLHSAPTQSQTSQVISYVGVDSLDWGTPFPLASSASYHGEGD